MIKIGTTMSNFDNSGSKKIRCFNLKPQGTNPKAFIKVTTIGQGSVQEHKPYKK